MLASFKIIWARIYRLSLFFNRPPNLLEGYVGEAHNGSGEKAHEGCVAGKGTRKDAH
jgi:hypothetical protein